ncbi:unnamed protein product [Calypogeia fissa]
MPSVKVYQVESEVGERTAVGTLAYKKDDTFADARFKLEKLGCFPFDFQFIDVGLQTRMRISWEECQMLENCEDEIVVIRSNFMDPVVLSSNASNGENITISSSVELLSIPTRVLGAQSAVQPTVQSAPLSSPQQDPAQDPELGVAPALTPTVHAEDFDTQVSFVSTAMPKDLQKIWSSGVDKLREHMKLAGNEDHKWKIKTWDADGVLCGHIQCCECHTSFSGKPSKGIMDKTSISNCFTNFKTKHLSTPKHLSNVAHRKGEKVDKTDIAKRAAVAGLSDRAILDQHVTIVNEINNSQGGSKATFDVVGDLEKEPMDLNKFKLFCTYCCEHLTMIPKQRNLQSNLESHCGSTLHLNARARSQRLSSGEPVLSGRPGRPRQADKREVRQKTIQGFFSADASQASQSGSSSHSRVSAPDKGKGTIDNSSLLCWGLWRDNVSYGGQSRPIKEILNDQLKVEGVWYAEPLVRAKVWCLSTQEACVIEGLFRHTNCSRISTEQGAGFQDLTCEHCFSIKTESDFRLRVLRESTAMEKRGTRDTGRGRRLDYLTIPEVRNQARIYRRGVLRERRIQRSLRHKLLMLQAKVPKLRDICGEAANQKNVNKFCTSIMLAHKSGAFGGRAAVWDMLTDIVSNLNKKQQGKRYKKGTMLLCQTLYLHGGRRVVDCLASNGIGPSLNTLQRGRRGMPVFRAGIHVEQFKFIASVYSKLKIRLGILGPVPCYLAEDETYVKKTVRWLPKYDTLLGFCGKKEDHECLVGLEIVVGDGEIGFNNIADSYEGYVKGHQARCIIVNPLVVGLPRLCILATITCGKFDAQWVRHQWKILQSLWDIQCLDAVGPLLGHASDGDSRRRKLMLQDYTGKGISGPRFDLGFEGWTLTHSVITCGSVVHASGLHDQDYIHNGKKLGNVLDSIKRILQPGAQVAMLTHVEHVYKLYDEKDHGLNSEDIARTDRQNWASAQRLCSRKVGCCLKMLRERKDAKVEQTLGTELYLSICADYMDIFMNTGLTLRQRIVLCGKVGFFFRLWRLWCFHGNHAVGGNTQPINFGSNCIPMQTFLDIQISVHFVVLLIIQFRDRYPYLPIPLGLTGSNACEQFFSKVGGMKGHERSYDVAELVDCSTTLNRLAAMDTSEKLEVGKSHKKHTNIWMKIHRVEDAANLVVDQSNYIGIETNAQIVEALKEGLLLAQNVATKLEMNPSTSARDKVWWNTPWITEQRGVKFGGWGDVNVDLLQETEDALEKDPEPQLTVESNTATQRVIQLPGVEDDLDDGVSDIAIGSAGVHEAMSDIFSEIVHESEEEVEAAQRVKPTVTCNGKEIYKSTVVSGFNQNPHLSKDRLTRVRQKFYWNNWVDKPKLQDGTPSMLIMNGSDCGVFFIDSIEIKRGTRSTEVVVQALKRNGKGNNVVSLAVPHPKRPRGKPVTVESSILQGPKYVWWIGRVQNIVQKYGNNFARARMGVDLLDRPESETCKVLFSWFCPIGNGKLKYKYSMCDPQWIDLECVISTVKLSVNPDHPGVFNLDVDDGSALDNFMKIRVT